MGLIWTGGAIAGHHLFAKFTIFFFRNTSRNQVLTNEKNKIEIFIQFMVKMVMSINYPIKFCVLKIDNFGIFLA